MPGHRDEFRAAALRAVRAIALARPWIYAAQALKYRVRTGEKLDWGRVVRDYPRWRQDQASRLPPLFEGLAWVTYGGLEFLERRVSAGARVFEYGAGGSTLFLASRGAHVISVEHDGGWVREVSLALASRNLTNATVLHVAPSAGSPASEGGPDDPDAYMSSNAEFAGMNFRAYASAIDDCVDREFDLVLIDGRARPSCCKHALPKIKPRGILMLDNAERRRYGYACRTMERLGWRRYDFPGAGPYNEYFWRTSAWERPADAERP